MHYPDDPADLFQREGTVGFNGLSTAEQVFHCMCGLEGEVNNGGFHQFFLNSSGDHVPATLDALERIGAPQTKPLLEKAIAIAFGDQPIPRDRDERIVLLAERLGGMSAELLEYIMESSGRRRPNWMQRLRHRFLRTSPSEPERSAADQALEALDREFFKYVEPLEDLVNTWLDSNS